jgi:proliferating cell nuclear antigen
MDNSHVALVSVKLDAIGFRKYRCDRPMPLGVNLGSLTKVLKCAKDDDIVTIKAGDDADVLNLTYEAKSKSFIISFQSEIWLLLRFVHLWSCAPSILCGKFVLFTLARRC